MEIHTTLTDRIPKTLWTHTLVSDEIVAVKANTLT